MARNRSTKPTAKRSALAGPKAKAKRGAAEKGKTKRGATSSAIHQELPGEILDALAAGYLARTHDAWDLVDACVTAKFPGAGSNSTPKDKYTRQVWTDKANEIANCVKGVAGYANGTQSDLATLIYNAWEKNLNDLVYLIYKKRDAK